MKLSQLRENTSFGSRFNTAADWANNANQYSISNTCVMNDGFVDVNTARETTPGIFHLSDALKKTLQKFPVKFGTVDSFSISNSNINSIEGFPHTADSISMANANITSFVGLADIIKHLGLLRFDGRSITKGGIGLILIEGPVYLADMSTSRTAFDIIRKYLGRPHDIFECQAELIEAGYEAFAEL